VRSHTIVNTFGVVISFNFLIIYLGRLLTLLPVFIDKAVFQNPKQPSFGIGALFERIDKSISFKIRILDEVFGIILIKSEPKSKIIHRVYVRHKLIVKYIVFIPIGIFFSLYLRHMFQKY